MKRVLMWAALMAAAGMPVACLLKLADGTAWHALLFGLAWGRIAERLAEVLVPDAPPQVRTTNLTVPQDTTPETIGAMVAAFVRAHGHQEVA